MKNRGILLAIVLFIGFVLVMLFMPSPKDLRFTYTYKTKAPHSCSILFNELNQIFPNAEVEVSNAPFNETLRDYEGENAAYIVIGDQFTIGYDYYYNTDSSIYIIDDFVAKGNQVFVSIEYFYSNIKGINGENLYYYRYNYDDFGTGGYSIVDSVLLQLNEYEYAQPKLPFKDFGKDPNYAADHLNIDSTQQVNKLGYIYPEHKKDNQIDTLINFVRIPHGKGNYFVFASPQMFTNYMLVNDETAEYSSAVLSHLGDIDYIIWDEFYKPFSVNSVYNNYVEQKSPLYLFSVNPALKIAKFLFLLGAILLIVTRFRRKQRPIPVVKPPNNKTVEFTKNMAKLYQEGGQHYSLAKKMMDYFEFDFRRKYRTKDFDHYTNNIAQLARLTQLDEEDLKTYYQKRHLMKRVTELSEYQLMVINQSIEQLK